MYGIANNCTDGKYVIFLDYDEKKFQGIKTTCKWLQGLFKLSDFYFFETNNGYHVVCFDKVDIDRLLTIMKYSSCCEEFRKTPINFEHYQWTLRLSQKEGLKPKHIYTLKSKYNNYDKSLAHIDIISAVHKIPINMKKADNSTELIRCSYPI